MDDDQTRLSDSSRAARAVRFDPGTLFAGRFRIVSLLGRGGMGEVYRAEDLKLEQTVALKLLPEALEHDPARLARFHTEVRVAREVSHRNVCRTYDIGEANGRHFITMEYVDGEDLSSLLRRIGRFSQDRAVEVARQICAGLAAAHERGVLHRDLKPANVMIDGAGHVRITDFGLAGLAGEFDDVQSGTPAYMAPEQLAGREVTARSDIYALGLVLFELFTGRRAIEAKTLDELVKLHGSGSGIRTPSSVVRDLDPTIERAILRCLEADPAKRPASALTVSAALPGGSPLAAALAAGETPSPEMVAAAGERSALRPAVGLAGVAMVLIALPLLAMIADRTLLLHQIPITKSNDALRDRAQELIEKFGYTRPPGDRVDGWQLTSEYVDEVQRTNQRLDRWKPLSTGRPPALLYWYRTGPSSLVPFGTSAAPSLGDPPATAADMHTVILDPQGRLLQFRTIPPATGNPSSAAPDWAMLFDAAALPMASFHPVEPKWIPRDYATARMAWEGPLPEVSDTTVRVEAAAYDGKPTFFRVIGSWVQSPATGPADEAPRFSPGDLFSTLAQIVALALLIGSAILARHNLRNGRGDRRGALRTAAVVFAARAATWVLAAHHYTAVPLENARFNLAMALALYAAATLWLYYMALEPYVRRFWPELLIGWTRLLSGRIRDPLVGRDILWGVAGGLLVALILTTHDLVPGWLGWPPLVPSPSDVRGLQGVRYALSLVLLIVHGSLLNALQGTFGIVLLKMLVRRTWLVVVIASVVFFPIAITGTYSGDNLSIDVPFTLLSLVAVLSLLLHFGLLSLSVAFLVFVTLTSFPLTVDMSKAYAGTSLWLMAATAALALFGFYASRGTEPLFGRTLLD